MSTADPASIERTVAETLAGMAGDPLAFALYAYPWGEKGTELEHRSLEPWQVEVLGFVRDGLLTPDQAVQVAVSSGNGSGKSCLAVILLQWAVCTAQDTRGVVTANTDTQLKTKTWPEMTKWYRLLICRDWFTLTATALYSVDPEHEKTWRIDQIPWSKNNPAAFAGLHNLGKRLIIVFDEAADIDDIIWETTEGALTDSDTEIIWYVVGNPLNATGRFRECFERFAHRWKTKYVDTRVSKIANQKQIAQWIADYGLDDDFVRIHVLGMFPKSAMMQFMPTDLVANARKREGRSILTDPLIIGVDVARHGLAESVIAIRKGHDARTHPWIRLRIDDLMIVASRIQEVALELKADAVFILTTGMGWGVYDRLQQLRVPRVYAIDEGKDPIGTSFGSDTMAYFNMSAEMWGNMRGWLKDGGAIPDEDKIEKQMTGRRFGYQQKKGRSCIRLEAKVTMATRGLESPDDPDALGATFAIKVSRNADAGRAGIIPQPQDRGDYDPLAPRASDKLHQSEYDPIA